MSTQNSPPIAEDLLRSNGTRPITVLHVDDEPDFADLVSVFLERENDSLEVVTETSADAGLDRLAEADIDCIVSDYEMPGGDGLEFLSSVRETHPRLPFILFTGKGSEEIASEAISAGVTDYLQKGSGTDQYTVLANRVTNAVRHYRAEQEIERGFQAMETAREGIGLLDEAGRFLFVNQAYADTYGYEREELVGEHWERLYPEEHVNQVHEEILPNISEGGRWDGESIHQAKDGSRLIIDHALAYTDSGSIICLIEDITEEKETQRALEKEQRQFETFVDAVEEYAIFALDPDGYVTSWNEGAARIKGYEAGEILGEHVSAFYPEDKVEAGYPEQLLEEALDRDWVTDEGWRVREDGSQFWADVTITAVFDDDGQHRGFLKVTRDASDRHEAREAIDQEREFLDMALNMLEDIFYVLDADGKFSRVTDRAVEVTGYTEDELLSMDPIELFPADQRDRARADIEEALETGASELEADLLTKAGRAIPYEFRKRRLTDADGTVIGVVGIGRDITDRKRRERQLQRQLEQFEHFGGVISHDLRTPLQTVEGRIELAQETGEMEHLDKAAGAVDRLETLIADLATVMREGELVGESEAVDIGERAREIWNSLSTDGVRLQIRETGQIRADEGALTRMLENLLNNAVEHGGETVTVGVLPDGFYLEDDGPGIPEDRRDDVFELGYSTKRSSDGTGFGLASAQQIAIAHGWNLTATEGDAGGARFEVTDVERA